MSAGTIVDAAIFPSVRAPDDLRAYMPEPWRSRPFPQPQRYLFPAPQGEPPYGDWQQGSRRPGELPASDPAIVGAHLDRIGAGRAILLPQTRGLLPDIDMGSMVCSATNDWLAATWLGEWNDEGRYIGSIRLNPNDPAAAVRELERWGGDPRMVQVAVPMEALRPYGQRNYFPLWEAVADLDLPVAVRADGGAGMDFHSTANGYPHVFAEYASLMPLNYIYHLTSLIAEGVFERLPKLRFVFTDGGHDLLMPLMWRMDNDWPQSKIETPWVVKLPSEYIESHVRFTTSRLEGPTDEETMSAWFDRSRGAELLMFASHYPHWTGAAGEDWGLSLASDVRARVLADNARRFYRLDTPVPA